jgi:hypothetical protein
MGTHGGQRRGAARVGCSFRPPDALLQGHRTTVGALHDRWSRYLT